MMLMFMDSNNEKYKINEYKYFKIFYSYNIYIYIIKYININKNK